MPDVKPYIPPEKTEIERVADARELQDTLNGIGEGVLRFIQDATHEEGNNYQIIVELEYDPPSKDDEEYELSDEKAKLEIWFY